MLLGQLGVSEGGNVVFDSSEYRKDKIKFDNVENYDLDMISELVDSNWESYNICDAFSNFSFVWDNESNSRHYDEQQSLHDIEIEQDNNDNAYEYEPFANFAENMDPPEDNYADDNTENTNEDDLISKILGAGSIVPGEYKEFTGLAPSHSIHCRF